MNDFNYTQGFFKLIRSFIALGMIWSEGIWWTDGLAWTD